MTIIKSMKDDRLAPENYIIAEGKVVFNHSQIEFKGKNNYVFLDKGVELVNSTLIFHGNNSILCIKRTKNNKVNLKASLYNNSLLFFNEGCSFNQSLKIVVSEAKNVLVGRDVMFSSGCWIRNSDVHLVYDKEKKRINHGKDIIIGDHVWVGQNVSLLKGSCVGSGAVLGAGAIVTKKVASNSVHVGNPSKQVKDDVFWDRQSSHFFTDKESSLFEIYPEEQDSQQYYFKEAMNLLRWQQASSDFPVKLNRQKAEKYIKMIEELSPLIIKINLPKNNLRNVIKKFLNK